MAIDPAIPAKDLCKLYPGVGILADFPRSHDGAKRSAGSGKLEQRSSENPLEDVPERDAALRRLVEALGLDGRSREALFEVVRSMLTQHLIWKQSEAAAPVGATGLALLKKVAADAGALRASFDRLHFQLRDDLMSEHLRTDNIVNRNLPLPISLPEDLHDFEICALSLLNRREAPRVGAPGNGQLVELVDQLIEVCEHRIGGRIDIQRTRNSIDDPHLPGRAGEFLCAAVALYVPGVTKRDVANAVRNLRDRQTVRAEN